MWRKLVVVAVLAVPLAAWALVKPVRVLAPTLMGLKCEHRLCIDDPSRREEAAKLYADALSSVQASLGALESPPRALFCSTLACAESFGFTDQNAYTFGTFAIVIGNRGWRPYFVRHELIHHLQNQRLGSLRAWLLKPAWFREGMAYSLSADPRKSLPEPLQGYRTAFEAWYRQVGPERLWREAEEL